MTSPSFPKTALLFPGQGAQVVGMGRDFYDRSPAARAVIDAANEAVDFPLRDLCSDGPLEALTPTEIQQPAILTASVAAWAALVEAMGDDTSSLNITAAVGHSLGEYSALVAAGALTVEQAVPLVRTRGALMQSAVPEGVGGMAALLGADEETAESICHEVGGEVWVANLNGGGQIVLAGRVEALDQAATVAKAHGIRRVTRLQVSAPFHCPMMQPAADALAVELAKIAFAPPRFPVIANLDSQANTDPARLPGLLRGQVTSQVRFEACVRRASEMGCTRFIECGPGGKVTAMARRILPDAEFHTLASIQDLPPLLESIEVRKEG
ncbi:MAG: ACP S-malonyltransferase [Deltaproteobacteria bacterium]|nr:ACP S-malonyltransferase [Deltaproteobacteria bacterium]MCB9478934.1 ACP S-malonyltransferase [Deltaproteobacteria bacterium]